MAKAEITIGEDGYRRVNRSFGPVPPTKEERLQATVTSLHKELADLKAAFESLTISGPGFSGSGRGIKFTPTDPTVTATIDCEADPPTITINVTT